MALAFARLEITWPIALFYAMFVVEEIRPEDAEEKEEPTYTLFALNKPRFRGELELLGKHKQFRVLTISHWWQARLLGFFWAVDYNKLGNIKKYYQPSEDDPVRNMQYFLRRFLEKFLSQFYDLLNVDAVLCAHVQYFQDLDYSKISAEQLDMPVIVMLREGMFSANKKLREGYKDKLQEMGTFWGSHMIVYNHSGKQAIVESGFAREDQVSALGAVRMDEYVKKCKDLPSVMNSRQKTISLFSFSYGYALPHIPHFPENRDRGFVNLFEKTHAKFANVAAANPEIEFYIKPKWGSGWIEEIKRVIRQRGLDPDKISNLYITAEPDPHDLIFDSDVVSSFNSTTMLEAAIAKKPVVVPYFEEAADPDRQHWISFIEDYDIFDVADDPEIYGEIIMERFRNPEISQETMEQRYRAFEKYVSSMDGNASGKYTQKIMSILDKNSQKEKEEVSPVSPAKSTAQPRFQSS